MSFLRLHTRGAASARLLALAGLIVALVLSIGSEARAAARRPSVARVAISAPARTVVSGRVAFTARVAGPTVREVVFEIDGHHRWATARRPYRYVVNSCRLRDGSHLLSIRAVYSRHLSRVIRRRIVVRNKVTARRTKAPTLPPSTRTPASPPPASTPPLASTPPPPAPASPVTWNGDLSTGDLSQYYVQGCPGSSIAPRGVSLVDSPVHPGWQHSMQFTVSDQSVNANCPLVGSPGRPNAEAMTPKLFNPGDDDYIGFSTLFPAGFPQICTPWVNGCFMQVAEIYGQPFGGASPVNIMSIQGKLVLGTSTGGIVWHALAPYQSDTWQDLVLHVKFSTDPTVGYVEIYLNGQLQTFDNGSTRYYEATLQPGVNWDGVHANYMDLDQYRAAGPALGTITLFHTGVKIGSSYAAAAP